MHGLVLRAIQCFLRDIWGAAFWGALAKDLRLPPAGFEAMLSYPPHLAQQIMKGLKPGACAVIETYVGFKAAEFATAFAASFAEPMPVTHEKMPSEIA